MTSIQIYNLYRALYSYRHVTAHWHGQLIKFVDVEPIIECETIDKTRAGNVCYSKKNKSLIIVCRDSSLLSVKTLQVEGKKTISALDFNNGFIRKRQKHEHFFD